MDYIKAADRLWNQTPVTHGNLVGGFEFRGPAIYTTCKPAEALAVPARVPAE
jgi:hypothetical protein